MLNLKPHPAIAILPMLEGDQLRLLKADIEKHGQLTPIIIDDMGRIVDGRSRARCMAELGRKPRTETLPKGIDAAAYAVSANLHRLHLDQSQRAMLAARLAALPNHRPSKKTPPIGGLKQGEAAKLLNVSTRTIQRGRVVLESGDKDLIEAVDTGRTNVFEAELRAKARQKEQERRVNAKAAKRALGTDRDDYGIIIGDSREISQEIDDESIDLILTDPPWDRASLPLYDALGGIAERVLRPGGYLITHVPHLLLPEALALVNKHTGLVWRCPVITVHEGKGAMIGRSITNHYHLLAVWSKGRTPNLGIHDLIPGRREKELHPWQQSTVEATYLIEQLTHRGDVVFDPLCGSGTTLVAAHRLGRRYIGHEIDEKTATIARKRLQDELKVERDKTAA